MGFPDSSVGEESTCNAGDPSLIPGLGRFAGEGIGCLLQYWGVDDGDGDSDDEEEEEEDGEIGDEKVKVMMVMMKVMVVIWGQ